jgi:pilus assembly protein CpaB
MQKRLSLIIGVVLAFITVFMVKMYLDQQQAGYREELKRRMQAQATQTKVLIAKSDIPKGVAIEAKMLEAKAIPEEFIQPKAATLLERIEGMVTAQAIAKGEQITLNKLISTQQASGASLAMATPVGKRAISIMVDNISSLAGMMRPGDYVDVIGMIPMPAQTPEGKATTQIVAMPLFQNVLVLAVGQELGGIRPAASDSRYAKDESPRREGSPIITLALSPQEANLIAFVQEQGKIRFIMRSPADSQVQMVPPASWDTLLQYILPRDTTPKVTEEEKGGRTVEIYRGLQKEVVPLSKSR